MSVVVTLGRLGRRDTPRTAHLLDQQAGLRQDGLVVAAEWPQNELRHPDIDVFGDARQDRISVADRERTCSVASGEFGVG